MVQSSKQSALLFQIATEEAIQALDLHLVVHTAHQPLQVIKKILVRLFILKHT